GKADEAFSLAERGRSRAFLDLLGTQTVLSKGKTRALVEEEIRLRTRLSEAKVSAQDATDPDDRASAQKKAEAVEREYRAFLERVRKENLEQASLMTVEPVTLEEIQRLLGEDTTLVEYLVTERESVVWVVDRSRVEVVRLPVRRADLIAQVRAFREGIEGRAPLPDAQARAEALHERLFARVRPHIRSNRVLLVPHDVLHYLPFGALRSPSGRWLVEDFRLATLPSASVLKYLGGKSQGALDRAMAVGNPDLGPALNLRYAEREARAVGERFPGATVLLRQEATKTKVKVLSNDAGLLHFATHGELNEQDPLASALLLVPDGDGTGRLEVREIFGLDLNARLVVLSACETGLGKLSQGDELVGLQRAFLYAGTPAVVTTLWKVDDRASFVLMREFYDQLKGGRDPAEALRRAQSAAMREFPHPFFWAAFTFTGKPQ
ncbi:MAG: CHAT domain-containing protein, partial [Candidatus Rokubacteria bacterium]|nr:CHAT domain-containing protein [Candidatus Rokubacteria bacterium]